MFTILFIVMLLAMFSVGIKETEFFTYIGAGVIGFFCAVFIDIGVFYPIVKHLMGMS